MPPLLLALIDAGVLTRPEAERIHRQLDPNVARDYSERVLAEAMQSGLAGQQDRVLELLQRTNYRPSTAQWAAFWAREDELLLEQLRPALLDVAGERAVSYAVNAGLTDTWQLVNESVIDWAQTYYANADAGAFGSIPNLDLTSRTRVLQAVTDWQLGELETAGAADGLPQLIRALEPVFGPERAERIAVTETTRIFSEATIAAELDNEFSEALRILTAADELVCPICGPLHNQVIPKRQAGGFVHPTLGSVGYPPFHVRCRCFVMGDTMAAAAVTLPQDTPPRRVPFTTTTRPEPRPVVAPVVAPPVAPALAPPPRPRAPTFATTKEAEDWASANISRGPVSYRGIEPDIANAINQSSYEVFQSAPNVPKWKGVRVGGVGKDEDALMATQMFTNDLRLSSKNMGSAKKYAAYRQRAQDAESYVKANAATITDPKLRQRADRALQFNRQLVGTSIDDLVTHEIGHHIDYTVLMKQKELRQSIIDRRGEYVLRLSSYADSNAFEFVAESFVAYRKGENDAVMPELAEFFKGLGL